MTEKKKLESITPREALRDALIDRGFIRWEQDEDIVLDRMLDSFDEAGFALTRKRQAAAATVCAVAGCRGAV